MSFHPAPRACLAAALAAAVIAALGLVAPVVARADADVSASNVVVLPVHVSAKWWASSSGDVVVWKEEEGLWGYDTARGETFQIPTDGLTGADSPKVSGDRVLFFGWDGRNALWVWDRSSNTRFPVAVNGSATAISGNTVVWQTSVDYPPEAEDDNVFGTNLSTGETFTVAAGPGNQRQPDVAGDWVVYVDSSGSHGDDIKAYNTVTKMTSTLCDWNSDQYNPHISESGFVVWQNVSDPSRPDATTDLYGRSVYGGDIRKIAGGRGSQHTPSIGGNIVVYSDSAVPGGYALLGYDLLSGTRFGISKKVAWFYTVAGIRDGTIAALYTDYDKRDSNGDYVTQVQLIIPTRLDVISDGAAIDESVEEGDDGIQGEENPDGPIVGGTGSFTAAALSGPSTVSTVVVSAASDWRSTVIASTLAGRTSPLLLTSTHSVPTAVLTKLAALAPKCVVVVGGSSSVSDAALAQLQAVVGADAVTRTAGIDAETRSIAVAAVVAARPGWDGTVLVAAGASVYSGLMATPASVWKGLPLVLADSHGLSWSQINALKAMGAKRFVTVSTRVPRTTILRLRSAVGTANVKVVGASSTASTSAKFAAWAVSRWGMSWNGLGIASDRSWSHTLTGALSRGRAGSVLLMSSPSSLTGSIKHELVSHHGSIRRASFVGNKYVVSNTVRRQVRLAIK